MKVIIYNKGLLTVAKNIKKKKLKMWTATKNIIKGRK